MLPVFLNAVDCGKVVFYFVWKLAGNILVTHWSAIRVLKLPTQPTCVSLFILHSAVILQIVRYTLYFIVCLGIIIPKYLS